MTTWTFVGNASWPQRLQFSYALTSAENVIISGGVNLQNVPFNDVWRSNIDLTSWTQLFPAPYFGGRQGGSMVLSGNNLLHLGGWDTANRNDVWVSPNDGSSWMLVTSSGDFPPRNTFAAVANGPIITIVGGAGGSGNIKLNDIWNAYV